MADKKLKLELIVDDKGTVTVKQFGEKAEEAADKGTRSFNKFSDSLKILNTNFSGVFNIAKKGGLILAGMGAAGGTALIAMTKSAANAGDEYQKMSQRVGVSVEALSSLSHAAELSGATISTVETSLKLLSKRMLDADQGLAEAKRSFEELGISVTNSGGSLRAADQVMLEIADSMKTMEDRTKATALAQELFGRSGTELLPMLSQGSEAIREMQIEAEKLGITWTQAGADSAANFNDALTRLTGSLTGAKNVIGQNLLPVMTKYIEKISIWISENKELIAQGIERFLSAFFPVLQNIAAALILISEKTADWIKSNDSLMNSGFFGLLTTIKIALEAIGVAVKIVTSFINLFKAACADIYETLFEPIIEGTKTLIAFNEFISKIMRNIYESIEFWLVDKFDALVDKIKAPIEKITGFFKSLYDKVVGQSYIPDLIRKIGEWFGRLDDEMVAPTVVAVQEVEKTFKGLQDLAHDTAQAMTQSFSDFFFDSMTGQIKTFEDYFNSFLRSIARAISDVMASMAVTAIFKGLKIPIAHAGGIVGQDVFPTRQMPALAFAAAPRLHSGLSSDEFPAILQRGETVIPEGGGGPRITVNLINRSGQPLNAETDQSRWDGQQYVVDVLVDKLRRNRNTRQALRR